MGSKSMFKYLLRRFIFLLVTYIVATTIVFILPRAIPGNPLSQILSGLSRVAQANPEAIRAAERTLMEEFGLGKPWYVQYFEFITKALRGDLGTSITFYPRKVIDLIIPVIPWTLILLLPATIVAWILGNSLGALAAYKRNTWIDKGVLTTSLIVSQIPYYWLGMIFIFLFGVKLGWLPVQGAYSQGTIPNLSWSFFVDVLKHYIMPFASIVVSAMGGWAIGMRLMVIYELGSDYAMFSEYLGMKDKRIFKYVFRNSLLPQITGLALSLGGVLGGALITEIVFNYPGTGYLLFRALTTLDYPLIQGIFVILIASIYLANFIVDFLYALIDPRIRLGQEA
ncbi:peptide ABC transporter permease [Thermotoga maritima MSB8]|uniref:Oligopeptide ABC transporter, permease protein n=1 Tax=Thermotoga maritima (strain ATCC 43589 / DSM 3109 / JCM 10099 / NBRC 100826 / MSB8) TaxID=243274 RepID=Q9WXN7_THEMA|nr:MULTISPECIES: ABC transporter permease [Thermotoga]AAD35124.1 oligopeptide ABC transporter, permease protein [Thermotoga maritima MSB8]AGL48953.1 Beta-glucoside ABC transport system, permease protein 1 [Thermotoga maritima MSB8]AHD18199.1 peptide ABC transporter permease [Thermotoga maritima MSB8]AIY86470.1 peptide ABC transporter permease [Thermotoga sp. 2812B]AKE25977.1 peptide ABC transporter permease [Thermotoga maritima]